MKRRHLSSLLYFLTGGLQMRDVQCHCAGQRRGLQTSFVLQFKEIYIERTSIFVSSKEGNFFSCLKIYFQMDFFLRKTVSFSKQCCFSQCFMFREFHKFTKFDHFGRNPNPPYSWNKFVLFMARLFVDPTILFLPLSNNIVESTLCHAILLITYQKSLTELT